ncbi:CGNR zinc finger domain-containing protein [Catenulispora yoronensis]|uniref:CGNR zinc finger domain-containing protein n=1 Tax=Catenulispora yoronensis TaxID=450799 RepID=A0ABN2TI13_9ACTN
MTEDARRVFRLDNEVLAFRFTATVSDRGSTAPRDRLSDPGRLKLWLQAAGIAVADVSATDLGEAVALREALFRIGTAIAAQRTPATRDVRALNTAATVGQARAELVGDTATWRLTPTATTRDALGILATDAIHVFGGAERTRIKTCENPDCAGLFLDTSHGANRRWCSMNTCGNKAKKSRLAAAGKRGDEGP